MISGYEVGPFEVGDDLVVECEVVGGDPLPQVTWWQSGMLYDSSDEVGQVLEDNAHRFDSVTYQLLTCPQSE